MAALRCRAGEPGDGAPGDVPAVYAARDGGRLDARQNALAAAKRTTGSDGRQRRRSGNLRGQWLRGCFEVWRCRTRGWFLSDARLFLADVDFFTGELEEQAHSCFVADPTPGFGNGQG